MSIKRDFFYAEGYLLLNPDVRVSKLSPIHHFLKYGIWEGRTNGFPKNDERCFFIETNAQRKVADESLFFLNNFSSAQYLRINPDVKAAKIDPWVHYVEYGSKEGRLVTSNQQLFQFIVDICQTSGQYTETLSVLDLDLLNNEYRRIEDQFGDNFSGLIGSVKFFSKSKHRNYTSNQPVKFVVAHELSRTGCPINAINLADSIQQESPIIFVALGEGILEPIVKELFDNVIIFPTRMRHNEKILSAVCELLSRFIDLDLAYLNSICSFSFGVACKRIQVKSILFIHEFSYYLPQFYLDQFQDSTDMIVFSNETIKKSFEKVVSFVRPIRIINQGKSVAPELLLKKHLEVALFSNNAEMSEEPSVDEIFYRLKDFKERDNYRLVAGAGSVEYRKGLDLFISVAEFIKSHLGTKKVKFIWLGEFKKANSVEFKNFLLSQIQLLDLEDDVIFTGSVKDVDRFYNLSDLFLLTSRLDPLPGVAIEALSNGLPTLIFDRASGFPDFFKRGKLEECICPYLNFEVMAKKGIEILLNENLGKAISSNGMKLVKDFFGFDEYVSKVLQLTTELTIAESSEMIPAQIADINIPNSAGTNIDKIYLQPHIFGLRDLTPKDLLRDAKEFDMLTGGNTGNMTYCHAIKLLTGEDEITEGWSFSLESMSLPPDSNIGILPLANQIGPHVDMSDSADALKKMTIPFVGVGLGAQIEFDKEGNQLINNFSVPSGSLRWLEELASKAPSNYPNISLRGNTTLKVMEKFGLASSCEVLGCPTLYLNTSDKDLGGTLLRNNEKREKICYVAGHSYWDKTAEIEQLILSILVNSKSFGKDIVYQSDVRILQLAKGEINSISDKNLAVMARHFLNDQKYNLSLRELGKHITYFYDVVEWMEYYKNYDFVIGPRIHGVMLALQAGVPALCIAVDCRTEELCEIMQVPYIKFTDFPKNLTKKDLDLVNLVGFDPVAFNANRSFLAKKTLTFMLNNRIRPSEEFRKFAFSE